MQMVESVAHETKCILSGLHARSETATRALRASQLTSFVTPPGLERLPVLFYLRLLLLFVRVFFLTERCFGILQGTLLADPVHLLLKRRDLGVAAVFPEDNCALIIRAGEHRAQTIPSHAVDRAKVVLEEREASLGTSFIAGEESLHQRFVLCEVFGPGLLSLLLLRRESRVGRLR